MHAGLSHLTHKIAACDGVNRSDLSAFRTIPSRRLKLNNGSPLIEAGTPLKHIYLICRGWAVCHRDLANGSRQVVNFLIPGDFTCLSGLLIRSASSSVTAVTELEVLVFDTREFSAACAVNAGMNKIVLW